ncbi:MFS transporter [Cellulomonas humilata]|uniref:MFS family arabinose efflux permease n=1 Tax=Cellulomonas humilata TaxID=144055 RepID=A0ABU0ED79_9CELL|nr:MFS transporter [Cellulomonas humilata]MDQ0372787.1 putative MFS family arabinose efflux permease [Cellulomonas humilata]
MTRTEQTTWRPGTVREAAGGLVALTLATFVAITTELVPVGLLPQISTDLEVTESVAGLLVTVYAFMVAALAIPLTLGTRRLPRKGLLLVTLVAYTVSNALVGIAPSFGLVAAGRAVGGIAHALFFSLSIGYASRLVLPQVTGRALALVTAGASAGLVLGVPLSTALGIAVGWRNGFLVLAAGCALATILVATLLPPVSGDDAPHADHTRTDRRRRLGIVSSANTLTYLAQYTVYTYVSVILLATGLAETAVGPVLLGLGAVGLVGTAYAALSLDRNPRRGTLVVHAVMALGLLALGVAFPSRVGVLVAAAVWSGAFGAMASVFQTAAIRTRGASPDIIGALVNSTANIGIGGGAALGGLVLVGPGLGALPYVGAGLLAVSLVVIVVARRSFPTLADPAEGNDA